MSMLIKNQVYFTVGFLGNKLDQLYSQAKNNIIQWRKQNSEPQRAHHKAFTLKI